MIKCGVDSVDVGGRLAAQALVGSAVVVVGKVGVKLVK